MAYTTIDNPEAYFQIALYTGDGAANNAITLPGDTDMQPDLVWIKNRDATDAHCLFDSVRGATKLMLVNTSDTETTDTDTLDSFTSDGFQVDADVKVNTSSEKYVAWCWKESATAGFDIVGYTGDGSARTISHSLSAVPRLMIVKSRTYAENWNTYNFKSASDPETDYLEIREIALSDSATTWNDTAPTSSVFSVGTRDAVNKNTYTYINYLWRDVQGFSKFGTYEGTNNANGPFVYTGFSPAFVMVKSIDSTDHWRMHDNKRGATAGSAGGTNPAVLYPHLTHAEGAGNNTFDILSNGFKWRNTDGDANAAQTYVFWAWAAAPFVNSNGAPANAR